MATTLEAVLELRDAAGTPVWESRTLHEIRVRDAELGRPDRDEVPHGDPDRGRRRGARRPPGPGAGPRRQVDEPTGKESLKKTLDFK